ncbi:MAG TPA: nucleotide exchange factor GrpE [Bryobacteraceae bacterium]|nr:nucleotide exchange factor GrpE [Bryobacteraceae bacterium]
MSAEKLKDAPDQAHPASGAAPEAAPADPPSEVDKLAAEKAEWQDRALRVQAEFQNFRRRAEKEKVELLEYASTEAVRPLLVVLDDFERALKAESADMEYAKGMELIYQRFFDALKKLGLEPIDSKGKPFDPHMHHAIDTVETDEAPDHTVLDEFQRAYNFKGKLLRPAMVKVAVTPQTK